MELLGLSGYPCSLTGVDFLLWNHVRFQFYVCLCWTFKHEALLNRNISLLLARRRPAKISIQQTTQQTIPRRMDKYEEMFNEAVDKTLNRVFGDTATDIIYSHLENNYSIRKNEVASKLESFSRAMEDYLKSGATVVKKEILESFYSGLGLFQLVDLERKTEFAEHIRTLIPH